MFVYSKQSKTKQYEWLRSKIGLDNEPWIAKISQDDEYSVWPVRNSLSGLVCMYMYL